MDAKSAVVVGSGIAGLAVACRLAARGYRVTVFEKNEFPGGKLSQIQSGGFRFDAGPSLFTMPEWVDEIFRLNGLQPEHFFKYKQLDTICKYYWDNGKQLNFKADLDITEADIIREFNESPGCLKKYLNKGAKKYNLVGGIFLKKPLNKWRTWWSQKVLKAFLHLPSYDLPNSLHAVNQRAFQSREMVQLFDRYATYNGSDPYRASGMFSMIPHIEMSLGAYAPEGGMISITHSLFELGKKVGVDFQFGKEVVSILHKDSKVNGVQTADGEKKFADIVVSNMDISLTYDHLLKGVSAPPKLKYEERSTSGYIFYLGMDREFPDLDVHNIFFSGDYKKEFTALKNGQISDDPTIYINISSKYNPADAPSGCENWFVMINVPSDRGQDWGELRQKLKAHFIEKVSRALKMKGSELESHIVVEEVMDPTQLSKRTLSLDGALYGSSSNSIWSAFLRQANQHSTIKNLYFCGGSVHPGGGIPLCLSSAKIVDQLVSDRH